MERPDWNAQQNTHDLIKTTHPKSNGAASSERRGTQHLISAVPATSDGQGLSPPSTATRATTRHPREGCRRWRIYARTGIQGLNRSALHIIRTITSLGGGFIPTIEGRTFLSTASGGSASMATNSWALWCRFRPTSLGIPTASWAEALRTEWMAQRWQWQGSVETQGWR
jgi:hypothetical protein